MIAAHLRIQVIRPTLETLGLWSQSAENLLLGTAAQESRMGRYLIQVGGGPALGIYQIEPTTHRDIWDRYLLPRKTELLPKIRGFLFPSGMTERQLVTNLAYQTAIARVIYLRAPQALPHPEDVPALASYWKFVWNTPLGAGTVEQFITSFKNLVDD